MIDVIQHINSVRREVGTRVLESGTAHTVTTGHVEDAHWAEFGPGAVGVGWDLGLLGLAKHLDAPDAAVIPADVMAWLTSDEGKELVRLSSDGWCAANIAAGAPEADAQGARDRTTAAYTAAAPEAAPA